MNPQDSTESFELLMADVFAASHEERDEGRRVDFGARRPRTICAGMRQFTTGVGLLYDQMRLTYEHLERYGVWNDRHLIFRAEVNGVNRKLCPLVEYPRVKNALDRSLMRHTTGYFIADNGYVAVIDEDGDYYTPPTLYWHYHDEVCTQVQDLLQAVRIHY